MVQIQSDLSRARIELKTLWDLRDKPSFKDKRGSIIMKKPTRIQNSDSQNKNSS